MEADTLILDRYRPLETLGAGGSGTVELCWDTRIQRRVAIKRMPLADRDGSGSIPGLAEARTGAMLGHPNIVSVIDFEVTEDEALLIMEAIEGATLAELIDATPVGEFDLDIAAAVAESVGEALDFAHENQVLHLDIKPENILITRGGIVKVSDFGVSELADAQGFGEASGGTIGYMPPEQMLGEDLDQRCDEFALGVVVYEMLTGRSPFMAPTLEASLRLERGSIPMAPSALRDDLDPELDAVLLSALSADRDARFETVYDFMKALSARLGDPRAGTVKLKELVRPEDEPRERPRPARRNFWERFTRRQTAVIGRAVSTLLAWGLSAIALWGIPRIGLPLALAAALTPGAAAAAKPAFGALIALVLLGIAGIVSPALPTWLGAGVVLAALVWASLARDKTCADANCALVSLPLGLVWLTPLAPLLAGFCLPPRRAALASCLAALLALALAIMTGSGSLLHFGPQLETSADVDSLCRRMLTSPATWTIIVACVISAVLVSFFCERPTTVSCTIGVFFGAVVLLGAQAAARWLQTGSWMAADPSWTIATLLALAGMIVICVLGTPRRDKGES